MAETSQMLISLFLLSFLAVVTATAYLCLRIPRKKKAKEEWKKDLIEQELNPNDFVNPIIIKLRKYKQHRKEEKERKHQEELEEIRKKLELERRQREAERKRQAEEQKRAEERKKAEEQRRAEEERTYSERQHKTSEDSMNHCKICGQPCGIYEICRECQQDITNGKVSMCTRCGKYYFTAVGCNCSSQKQEYRHSEEKERVNINIEDDNSTPFKDGVSKGFGTGCGCFIAIGIVVLIIILIAIAGVDGIMDTLGIK